MPLLYEIYEGKEKNIKCNFRGFFLLSLVWLLKNSKFCICLMPYFCWMALLRGRRERGDEQIKMCLDTFSSGESHEER